MNSVNVIAVIVIFMYGMNWLFGFYGISIIVGYFMPNPFLYK